MYRPFNKHVATFLTVLVLIGFLFVSCSGYFASAGNRQKTNQSKLWRVHIFHVESPHDLIIIVDPYQMFRSVGVFLYYYIQVSRPSDSSVGCEVAFINHLLTESDCVSLLWTHSSKTMCWLFSLSKAMKLNICGREIMGEARCKKNLFRSPSKCSAF